MGGSLLADGSMGLGPVLARGIGVSLGRELSLLSLLFASVNNRDTNTGPAPSVKKETLGLDPGTMDAGHPRGRVGTACP